MPRDATPADSPPGDLAHGPGAFRRPDFISEGPPETSLSEPAFDEEATEIYTRATHALADGDVPFLVGGALALNRFTGIWRDTKDLDVYVKRSDLDEALGIMEAAGFETGEVYKSWLAKAWTGDTFVDFIHRGANGVHPVTDEWFARADPAELFGREVGYLSAEDLILGKIFVGNRVRFDGADILHLLYAKGGDLDWDLLIDLTGEHAGLLLAYLHMYRWAYPKHADHVPEDAIGRLEERARADMAAPPVPFRATLLDLVSFRVDVDGWGFPDPHKDIIADLREQWDVPAETHFT